MRAFRAAFDVLKKAAPRLCKESQPPPKLMSPIEIEAMKQRRLEKRQRQRQERRVQRIADKVQRISQRHKSVPQQSSSSSAASSWQPLGEASAKSSRKLP